MKIKFLLLTFLFSVLSWGQSIFENPITGTNPNTSNPYIIGQTINTNIVVSGIGRGSGINGSNANDRYNANNWNSASFNSTKYFEFTLTPNSGFQINFVSFVYNGQASGTGASSFAFRSSLDGFTSNIGTPNAGGTTINLSAGTYQNISSAITFRLYGWGASSGTGSFSINDFIFNGSVIPTCTPPANPSGTITATTSCGSTSLAYSTPSATAYWQTTATGTSTANPTTSPLVVATNGTYYVRNFVSSCWSTGNVSQAITIANAVNITTQPTSQATTVGNTATFSVTASNAVSYQWEVSTNSGGTWSNVGTNTNSYTTPSATLAMSGYQYRVIITGNTPCANVTSSVGTLTVTTGPCLSESSFSSTPSGWVETAITYTGGEANFVTFDAELATIVISNPASLTFDLRRSGNTNAKDLLIEISTTTQAGVYTTIATYNHSNTTASATTAITVDLSAYTSFSTVYIKFRKVSSTTSPWYLDNVNVFCGTPCTPAVVTVAPLSGPVGTEVTITATSGDLTGSSVFFGGTSATIVSNSATEIVAIVPSGYTTGDITITDSQPCDTTTAFLLISSDNASCEGATTSDLIIYDIHDEQAGSGGFITLYNGTALPVNLLNYTLYRTSTHDDGNEINYATLTGTIASGALGIIKVSPLSCGPAATNGSISGGFNEDDGIQLRNAAGTVVIDDVDTYSPAPGYYMVRNSGALSARASYVAGDWNTITLAPGECYPSAGIVLPSGLPPTISAQPTVNITCTSSTATLSVTATEGFAGGNPLAYQWYVVAPNTATWTALTNAGVYSGANSNSLLISSLAGLNNYQYYCQVRENGATCYQATIAVKITDLSTVWNGTTWSNGIPDSTKFATINGNYDTTSNGNIECCSLLVNTGFTLDIQAATYVEIQYNLTVNGTLNVLNNGSLVQVDDSGINTGNISYQRSTTGVALDYVYWSSPVAGINTPSSGYIYSWSPTFLNPNGGEGYWISARNTAMQPAIGYIMRDIFARNFIGVPNNGVFTTSIARGSDLNAGTAGPNGTMRNVTDDNWNLLGNPYPSAISINSFLTANTDIDGFVRLWTHGTSPSTAIADPFYDNFVSNYTAGDYIAINGAGATSGSGTLSVIGGGQSFFTLMDPGAATTSSVLFNNSMRNKGYSNSQFYRSANKSHSSVEKSRIWLDLQTPTNEVTRILVAYVDDATNLKDRMYDALTDYKSAQNLYTLIGEDVFAIQGRATFNEEDKVPVGFKTSTQGSHTISIAEVDGLFENGQNIYLEDKDLNIIHDLRQNPYRFYALAGINNERFILRYTDARLSNEDIASVENSILISSNDAINVFANALTIESIQIHNVLGQLLFSQKGINTNTFTISSVQKNNAPLIIQVTLANGNKVTKKVIF